MLTLRNLKWFHFVIIFKWEKTYWTSYEEWCPWGNKIYCIVM